MNYIHSLTKGNCIYIVTGAIGKALIQKANKIKANLKQSENDIHENLKKL